MPRSLPHLTANDKLFIQFVRDECRRAGVSFEIRPGKYLYIEPGSQGTGFFDGNLRMLKCALGRKGSIGTLAHEYCHLTQWEENCPIWDKATRLKCYEKWAKWMGDANHKPKEVPNINRYISIIRDLELDNEKRTVKIIKKYGLSIDPGIYTQTANAYVHFYNYMKKVRRWTKANNSAITNPVLYTHMSKKFDMNYRTLEPWIEKIFIEQNI